MSVVLQVDT